jgi:hypothetical protein
MKYYALTSVRRIKTVVVASSVLAAISYAAAGEPERDRTPPGTTGDKERLRYAGRTFDEWREQLLYDLDAETRVQAMPPIATFGRNGYGREAVEALTIVLHDDRDEVAQAAATALAEIGPAALESLTDGLGDKRAIVRACAAQALGGMGVEGRPAADALVKLVDDKEHNVRLIAVTALVGVTGDDDSRASTFERLASSPDDSVRVALATGVQRFHPKADWWLPTFLLLADDDNEYLRQLVAQTLAAQAPPENAVVDAMERLINDTSEQVRLATGGVLISPPVTTLKAVVLAKLLASRPLRQVSTQDAIRVLGRVQDDAELVVPVLGRIAASRPPEFEFYEIVEAIDSLARLGRSAKAAVPAIERWAFDEQDVVFGNDDSLQKHARRALRKIAAAEDKSAVKRE